MIRKFSKKSPSPGTVAATLLSMTLVVAILHLARMVLVPIALAVLLTFILTPVVTRCERWRTGRIAAVLIVVLSVGLLVAAMLWSVVSQIHSLASDLPKYRENIRQKIETLRKSGEGGVIKKVRSTLEEAARPKQERPGTSGERRATPKEPVPVRIVKEDGAQQALAAALASILTFVPALQGLATGGLALVLVIFMLVKREDLRNRIVSFASDGSLATTTKAIDDAGHRISRYLFIQLIVNGTFGIAVAIGLLLIGVPYALLFGLCAAVFRYVPYIGPWVAAVLPISASLITSPGWTQSILVLGLFLILELGSNNFMEPWLYGQGIGLSAVGLLVSAAFWTWIWGPIGLVLATPLTVCLVVMGRYIPALSFLDRLLGDQPALPAHAAFLQRLIARDDHEASGIAREYRAKHDPESVYDDLLVPALRLARHDRLRGNMTAEEEYFILEATRLILEEISADAAASTGPTPAYEGHQDESEIQALALPVVVPHSPRAQDAGQSDADFAGDKPVIRNPSPARITIVGCAAHHESEELTLRMLSQLIERSAIDIKIFSTKTLPGELIAQVKRERPALVVVAVLPPGGRIQARYLCKLLRKHDPKLSVVVGCWGFRGNLDRVLVSLRSAGAHYVTTTLLGARNHIVSLVRAVEAASIASNSSVSKEHVAPAAQTQSLEHAQQHASKEMDV